MNLSLTEFIFKNLKTLEWNVELLEDYGWKQREDCSKTVVSALNNLKNKKGYDDRTMKPLIKKLKQELYEFLDSKVCKDYFLRCEVEETVIEEESRREICKS